MQDLSEAVRRVLIIDDNPSIHEDYRKILASRDTRSTPGAEAAFFGEEPIEKKQHPFHLQLDSAYQGQEALKKVQLSVANNDPYLMAFVDMRMPPGWDGLKTIEEIWKIAPDLQVVLCTAYSDKSWDEICDRLGHTDNLLILKKPFDNIEVSQLAIALTEKRLLTRDAQTRQQDLESMVEQRTRELKRAALHDPLTGLPNRVRFQERLDQALGRVRRSHNGIALLLVDLDGFKEVNDTLGHPAGDQLIQGVADRLASMTRETDCVARLGGDEFAIVQVPVANADEASVLADRLLDHMQPPFVIDGNAIQAQMSIGIAIAPQDGTSVDEMFKHADLALYRAKADGKSCYRFFEKEMDRRIVEKRQLVAEIRRAVRENEFELFYQPIMDVETERPCCFEALLRWRHPKRGILPPSEFLSVAESSGLIATIGEWAMRQACIDAGNWPDDISVAVNVSAIQFLQGRLLSTVQRTLRESGINPSRLELEIVESIVLKDSSEVVHVLDQLNSLGVRIVMDDFGTGYSSLSYLKNFPFNKLKLDRSFVQDLVGCSDALAIIRAVATLGECLGLELTAEGVETPEQLAAVKAEGYERIQGFLFARPMPIHELVARYLPEKEVSHRKVDMKQSD